MKARISLTATFTAMALGLAACGDPTLDPHRADPMTARSVGLIFSRDGILRCHHTMIGPNLAATALHCVQSQDRVFSVRDESGAYVTAYFGNFAAPGTLWVNRQDAAAPDYRDKHYYDIASDKAVTLLEKDIGTASGIMPIASLEAPDWQPMAPGSALLKAPVTLLAYWPASRNSNGYDFYKFPCQAYRLPAVRELVAHDCPTRSGVSGAPLTVQNQDGTRALFAVHQGIAIQNADSPLIRAFAPAFAADRHIGFAAVFSSMPALCEEISNCRTEQSAAGFTTLSLTQ